MSNSSLMGTIKKRYQSLVSIFSKSDSDSKNTPQRINAFNMKRNRRNQFTTLLTQKEVVTQLVHLYRQNDCLWNPNCPDFKSTECQERVWREIASAIDVNMPVVLVKRKVHVLRSQWEVFKDLPTYKSLDYPDLSFLNEDSKSERVDSGSEQTQLQFLEKLQGTETNIPSESKIINKSHHISNLCEVIRMDLEPINDKLFFEAKWRILDVLRDTQLKQLQEDAKGQVDELYSTSL